MTRPGIEPWSPGPLANKFRNLLLLGTSVGSQLWLGRFAYMTSIDSHCTRSSSLVNPWPARSPGICAGRFSKDEHRFTLHLVILYPAWVSTYAQPHRLLNPYMKDLVTNSAWWETWINKLCFTSLNLAITLQKRAKTFIGRKVNAQLIAVQYNHNSVNCASTWFNIVYRFL